MDDIKHYYYCDTTKNKECNKSYCYINGGGCIYTSNKEYALDENPKETIQKALNFSYDRELPVVGQNHYLLRNKRKYTKGGTK